MTPLFSPRPDDPTLSRLGPHPVGVRTLTRTAQDRIDIALSRTGVVRGARSLTLELWYPAGANTTRGGTYRTLLRDGVTPITLHGSAVRAAPPAAGGPLPLVVISHGYPGNRLLMAHFAEHLASHGYVVAAADHPQSTYDDQGLFGATLYHRPLDQAFILDTLTRDPSIAVTIDPNRRAIIGYSMGGYGALVLAGAGITQATIDSDVAPPHDILAEHRAGSPAHSALRDIPLGAVIAIGPWGMGRGVWDTDGLAGLRTPLMIMAGSADTISDYSAMRAIAEGARSVPRHLLTFENAGHNAAAPIPAPAESHAFSDRLGWHPFDHYADSVWDTARMNAIARHLALAFLARHLNGPAEHAAALDIAPEGGAWPGFGPTAPPGLRLERFDPA